MKTYTIDVAVLGKLTDRLNSFQRKFKKYGNGEITYEVSEPYAIRYNDGRSQLVVDVTVDASYKIGGYTFVGVLEMTERENLIKKASEDVVVPTIYRTRCECDHCKKSRIRKHTVLLVNTDSGEYVQVGRACVKDYIGQDLGDYASYLTFFSSLDEEVEELREKFPRHTPSFTFEEIVLQALEYTKRFGYKSKQMAYDTNVVATSTAVYAALNGVTIYGENYEVFDISDETNAKYEEVVKFVLNLDDSSDYNHNLKVLMSLPYIDNKNLGLAVSAVGSYLRFMAEKQQRESTNASDYIGAVGDKIEFRSTPKCVYMCQGDYGWTYLYRMTVDGNVIMWKTNKELDEGVEVTIKATIKEHSEYRGVKQTTITRGRVVA